MDNDKARDNSRARDTGLSASGAYRSILDIARILEDLSRDGIAIQADLGHADLGQADPGQANLGESGDSPPFVSTILRVEPDASHFVVAYVEDDAINSRLYRQPAIKFSADYQGDRITFFARDPLDGLHDGTPAIYFPMPESMHRYRRTHERVAVPTQAGLRCIAHHGHAAELEMRVLDISEGGIGCLIHIEHRPLAAGDTLTNCSLTHPGGPELRVDMVVQYAMPTLLPNGAYAQRLGLRFLKTTDELRILVKKFAA